MRCLTVIMFGILVMGCASGPKLSQAQLNAIETREVDANLDRTFTAASNALFDAGYTIAMSDRQAGLLTGTRSQDNRTERLLMLSASIVSGTAPSGVRDTSYAISVHIEQTSPSRSLVRIKTAVNGRARVDKKAIDRIWVLMQRQVMMREAPAVAKG